MTPIKLTKCVDECLDSIFKSGKVLSYALTCLESKTSTQRQRANAALLLANMARNENNCQMLVERGVVPHLVTLLKEEESKEVWGCSCIPVGPMINVNQFTIIL